ncbi:RNA-binding protein [Paenibacillus yanchengensis]|uniref:RNA-binding protein n=1 Tax=Paenibacillus yanchengensis TaxID=2035833 RepID=A0ABW4YKM6_9BACL
MKEGLYDHFHADEKIYVDRVLDWLVQSSDQHKIILTEFLDPRQVQILLSLSNRYPDVQVKADGGFPAAERKRVLLAPEYIDVESESSELTVLEVKLDNGMLFEADHGDFLGSVLGLGIKRDRIGDIHVHDRFAHIVVTQEIAVYLDTHLRQVHRHAVFTSILPVDQLVPAVQEMQTVHITVASMRLDGVASDVYRLSRTKIMPPIRAGRCKVNWKPVEDPSHQLYAGDVVSMKGFGRFKVLEVDGVTKKGRIRVQVGTYL